MISAYAAAVRKDWDEFRARGVLVLQGLQELGKTTFLKILAGGTKRGLFSEGLMLDADDRDNKKLVNKYWIVELGELENTTLKKEIF